MEDKTEMAVLEELICKWEALVEDQEVLITSQKKVISSLLATNEILIKLLGDINNGK